MFDLEYRNLDDLLNELKVYGPVHLYNKEYKWHCEYNVTVKGKEYMFETSNEDLISLVRSCLTAVYVCQARK